MARQSSNKGRSGGQRGRHRAKTRSTEAYAWLGAGAITLGIGAATLSSAAVANADDSSSPPSNGPSSSSDSAATGSGDSRTMTSASDTHDDSATSTPAITSRKPPRSSLAVRTGNASGDAADQKADATATSSALPSDLRSTTKRQASTLKPPKARRTAEASVQTPVVSDSGHSAGAQSSDDASGLSPEDDATKEPAPTIFSAATPSIAVSTAKVPVVRAAATSNPPPTRVDTSLQALALLSAAGAIDPAREAYLRQFRSADPDDLYFTPASSGYSFEPQVLTDAEYAAFIADHVATTGTRGFKQTTTGALQYTNPYTENVAVLYARKAAGIEEPAGIMIVRPGQSVVIPYPSGAVASAQLPKVNGAGREIAVAAIGYPPFTGSSNGTPTPTQVARGVVAYVQTVVSHIVSNVNQVVQVLLNKVKTAVNLIQSPVSTAGLYKRLRMVTDSSSNPSGIWIDKIKAADGNRYVVYLGGTNPTNIIGGGQSVYSNLPAYNGHLKLSQVTAIVDALAKNNDMSAKIMLVGYSQGGLDAQNIAEKLDNLNVTTVVTFGTAILYAPPSRYRIIHLGAYGDPVNVDSKSPQKEDNIAAGNTYSIKTSNYGAYSSQWWFNPIWNLQMHGDISTYTEVASKFDRAGSYGAIKSNIAKFSGAVTKP